MRILNSCSLASFKLSTLGVCHPSRIPSLFDCSSTRPVLPLCYYRKVLVFMIKKH